MLHLLLLLTLIAPVLGQNYRPSKEVPPLVQREFRAAWSACVYNIDWPSQPGLSAGRQKSELISMLNKMQELNMNALIFQVRPNADAVYNSRLEPWSHWISGTMGRSPGYDPLAFCIAEAHRRGIEVHAWFNPFRALPNAKMQTAGNHITRTHPKVIRNFKTYKWMDISQSFARRRALDVILDVVKRYDVDGVHIDDYFYPYPDVAKDGRPKQIFPDGKTPEQRRGFTDAFVRDMYREVKQVKPWVRVGISPFGIWRPGVPAGTTATIDSFFHLSADSRKWLAEGWCDYMSPQLYWRIDSKQSFHRLLSWWRKQGSRPVWPGIATSRINSKEDRGRKASEIINQISLSRQVGRNWVGHCHWSVKAIQQNRGGIATRLKKEAYLEPVLVPPMPWLGRSTPETPRVGTTRKGAGVGVSWSLASGARKYVVQARYGKQWRTVSILDQSQRGFTFKTAPDALSVTTVDALGNLSRPAVLGR